MVEGTPESAVLAARLLVFIVLLPFRGLYLLGVLGAHGYRRLFVRRPPVRQLVDYKLRQLPDSFRSGIQWSITIDGRAYRIASVDDLPEEHRETMRARLASQAEAIHQILGVPALPPAPAVPEPPKDDGDRPQDIADELSALNPVRGWDDHVSIPAPSDSWGSEGSGGGSSGNW